ncbi:MAG TPA: class I SAM-dependent methyltransferase [Thermoanaerobaculia bacterium]|nr:class I SAM-dependent methyltransferase [Thermoanaerobaculia bacterium]
MTEGTERPFRPWTIRDVVDVDVPAFALRTYLEQAGVRRFLARASGGRRLRAAAEVGCGYGRLLPVLAEFADRVAGFERQPEFAAEAARLHPAAEISRVTTLANLPAPDAAFDVVLTFTVLQHLPDPLVEKVAREIRRLRAPGGHVLLCEETDPSHLHGDPSVETEMCTVGRTPGTYSRLLAPLRLLESAPRVIEPTYPRADVGLYLFFGE